MNLTKLPKLMSRNDVMNYFGISKSTLWRWTNVEERLKSFSIGRRKWYKHVFQVPMIVDGKFSYFFDKENKTKIMTYSNFYRFLDENEFLSRFYE